MTIDCDDQRYSTAHACYNELVLPTIPKDYNAFVNAMKMGIAHKDDYSLDDKPRYTGRKLA
jgi:hypothetical protein